MAGDVASVFQRIAWLVTPRQIPNDETGNLRRNGHCLSCGSTISSELCWRGKQKHVTIFNSGNSCEKGSERKQK